MKGLRDDVDRGLDDGWSRGSRTVPVDTALVCSTPEVSASMITTEVLTDQQHERRDTRESETPGKEAQGRLGRSDRLVSEAGRGIARKWQPRERRARSQRQTASIPREQMHASNDVRSQDAERCEESDARYLLSLTCRGT